MSVCGCPGRRRRRSARGPGCADRSAGSPARCRHRRAHRDLPERVAVAGRALGAGDPQVAAAAGDVERLGAAGPGRGRVELRPRGRVVGQLDPERLRRTPPPRSARPGRHWPLDPRSICNHCGSEKALPQRVPGLPSTAAEAGTPACSVDEAVAGRFSATFAVPQAAARSDWATASPAPRPAATKARAAAQLEIRERARAREDSFIGRHQSKSGRRNLRERSLRASPPTRLLSRERSPSAGSGTSGPRPTSD